MRKIVLLLAFLISFAFSAINECKTDVYFGNGILTTDDDARSNAEDILEPAIRKWHHGVRPLDVVNIVRLYCD